MSAPLFASKLKAELLADIASGLVDITELSAEQLALIAAAGPVQVAAVNAAGAVQVGLATTQAGIATTKATEAAVSAAAAGTAVLSVRENAFEEFYSVSRLAQRKSGVYLRIHPEYCFQERSVSATTPALNGDPVGCIKSADGGWFAIATQDDRRPTLKLDEAGNWCLGEGPKNMRVTNAAGVAYNPTDTWTHIGGWRASGTAFSWGGILTAGRREVRITPLDFTGSQTSITTANNVRTRIYDSTQDPITVPHVLRIAKSPTDAAAYYNDDPARKAGVVVPWDDTGVTRQLALFAVGTAVVDLGNDSFNTGRFYGGLWVPGTLTADETRFATAEIMANTIPVLPLLKRSPDPVVLDFDAGTYTWGGVARTLADLTSNGGGSYTLNDMRWWGQERTIIIDIDSDLAAGSHSGTFLEFLSGNARNEIIGVDNQAPQSRRISIWPAEYGLASVKAGDTFEVDVTRRMRIAFICRPGKPIEIRSNQRGMGSIGAKTFYSIPPTGLKINTVVTGMTLRLVAVYGEALSDAALFAAMNEGTYKPIHVVGDSFVDWATRDFGKRIFDYIYPSGPILLSNDAIGGTAFYEANGTGSSQRFARTPQHHGKTVILNDGGFEIRSFGSGIIGTAVMSIVEKLSVDANGKNQWLIMEPNPIVNNVGTTARDEFDVGIELLRRLATTTVPSNERVCFVDTLEIGFCLYDGSANDKSDVLVGRWPRSLSSDLTHYLIPMRDAYARAAVAWLRDLGWAPGTTALPGAVTSLAGAGLAITWSPPAADGGHPVKGYQIQYNTTGTTWVTQAPQGSPTLGRFVGNTKQYIREWTAPVAGKYRIAAITQKGTGPYTEVTVA